MPATRYDGGMILSLWNSAIYYPLYNGLIWLVDVLPGHSVGLAIIALTILVKLVIYPLTMKSIIAQRAMKELEPELKKIRDKYSDNKQKQAEQTMALYKERGVTPFSGCLPMLVQIPIIIGLYFVFFSGIKEIDPSILYSFVKVPLSLDMQFLMFDLAGKSIILALFAGISQYFQTSISLGKPLPPKTATTTEKPSFQEDFARSMQIQMRYVLPIMVGFIAFTTSAAVALYWVTSNILSIGQELLVKRSATKV